MKAQSGVDNGSRAVRRWTPVGMLVVGLGGLALLVAGTGAALYASDVAVTATVVGTECAEDGGTVTMRTAPGGFELVEPLDYEKCEELGPGNHIVYNVRSERLRLYESEGGCLLYDSEGPAPAC